MDANLKLPAETLELTILTSVVKHASFARAAEDCGLTPSGVSRIISRLEDRLGARLLQRSTRKISLTEAGVLFHARAVQILADLGEAEAEVSATALQPRGILRLNAPVVFGRMHIVPLLGRLSHQFPELSVDLTLADRFVDLIDEGVDLAVRIGALPDSRLVARRLCSNRRLMVASASYLSRRGTPSTPADLVDHECFIFTAMNRPREWRLMGPDGPVTVSPGSRLSSNNGEALTEAAKEGLGVALGATFAVSKALLSGELVRVLPDYEFEPTAIHAVYPSARQLSSKVRSVVDVLSATFKDPPGWDRSLHGKVAGF